MNKIEQFELIINTIDLLERIDSKLYGKYIGVLVNPSIVRDLKKLKEQLKGELDI